MNRPTKEPSRAELAVFSGLVIPVIGIMIGVVGSYWVAWPTTAVIAGVIVGLGVCGCLFPSFTRPVYTVWAAISHFIGRLVTIAVLTACFVLVVLPIGLSMRCFGWDPMKRRFDRTKDSYWEPRETETDKRRYFKQY